MLGLSARHLQGARALEFATLLTVAASLEDVCLQVHELVEKAQVVREGWNGYNVLHDSAARVAALDLGFLPSARSASAPPPKLVYLLGSDDFAEEDVPKDAFVIYQVCASCLASCVIIAGRITLTSWLTGVHVFSF
jgi:NADH dehydrogenase/NADH:ubiquinone oxidoreductase subunit G